MPLAAYALAVMMLGIEGD